jgi:hypothetical protein
VFLRFFHKFRTERKVRANRLGRKRVSDIVLKFEDYFIINYEREDFCRKINPPPLHREAKREGMMSCGDTQNS